MGRWNSLYKLVSCSRAVRKKPAVLMPSNPESLWHLNLLTPWKTLRTHPSNPAEGLNHINAFFFKWRNGYLASHKRAQDINVVLPSMQVCLPHTLRKKTHSRTGAEVYPPVLEAQLSTGYFRHYLWSYRLGIPSCPDFTQTEPTWETQR